MAVSVTTAANSVHSLSVPAPAKLNLFLHVTGRRGDGYHLLESLMVLIDLFDSLRLTRRDDGAVLRNGEIEGISEESDLALRAAKLLQQHAPTPFGVTIALDKRIPIGAGLGGGSSDAASVLLALNRLWSLDLPRDELMRIGLELGADVPFFIFGSNAHATGVGECLRPVTVPRMDAILAIPHVQSSTAEIFGSPLLRRDTPTTKADAYTSGYGHNDLEPVAMARHPGIAKAADALAAIDARPPLGWTDVAVRMSGSGSTMFRLIDPDSRLPDAHTPDFHTPNDAAQPQAFRMVRTRFLTCHPLREFAAK